MAVVTDPNDPGFKIIQPSGQQENYLILSDEERAKGFQRPVRRSYIHLACGTVTKMGQDIAETYARDPTFYGGTFCCNCDKHFNLRENGIYMFIWVDDGSGVGS